jgi:prepilin-type N-terminal cleavage/methylation domain-containing protein
MKSNRAFTLIELLVVIAIIAILAAIVLVSLSSAQKKAKDARLTADMNQIRSAAQVINSTDGNYDKVDCTIGDIKKICDDIASPNVAGSAVTIYKDVTSGSTAYCAVHPLVSDATKCWCVDSNLISKQYPCTGTGAHTCTGTTSAKCE